MATARLFERVMDGGWVTLGILWFSGITDHLAFAMIVYFCHANFDITYVFELLDEGDVGLVATKYICGIKRSAMASPNS